ncbi:hypothetical protein ACFLWX_02135 [Chloroflexota bacterium]
MEIFGKKSKQQRAKKRQPTKKQRLEEAQEQLKLDENKWNFDMFKEQATQNPDILTARLGAVYGFDPPKTTPAELARRQIEADRVKMAHEVIKEDPDMKRRVAEMELRAQEAALGVSPVEGGEGGDYGTDFGGHGGGYENPFRAATDMIQDMREFQEAMGGGGGGGFSSLFKDPQVAAALLGFLGNMLGKSLPQNPQNSGGYVVQTEHGPVSLTREEYVKYMLLNGSQQQLPQGAAQPIQGALEKKEELPKQEIPKLRKEEPTPDEEAEVPLGYKGLQVRDLLEYSDNEPDEFVAYLVGRAEDPNDFVAQAMVGMFLRYSVEEFMQSLEQLKSPENAEQVEMFQTRTDWLQEVINQLKEIIEQEKDTGP